MGVKRVIRVVDEPTDCSDYWRQRTPSQRFIAQMQLSYFLYQLQGHTHDPKRARTIRMKDYDWDVTEQ